MHRRILISALIFLTVAAPSASQLLLGRLYLGLAVTVPVFVLVVVLSRCPRCHALSHGMLFELSCGRCGEVRLPSGSKAHGGD